MKNLLASLVVAIAITYVGLVALVSNGTFISIL